MVSGAALDLAVRCGLAAAVLDPLGKPSLSEDEQLKETFDAVSLVLAAEDQGPGTLFVTTRCDPDACMFNCRPFLLLVLPKS